MSNLFEDSFVINLHTKKNEKSEGIICMDWDAKSLAFQLEELNLDNPDQDMVAAMKKLKEAILFILWNTNWPEGD